MATAQVVRFQTEPTTLGPSTSKSSPPKRAVKNGNGLSPLMLACQQGRSEDVRQILKRKGNGTRERTRNGRTAFHYCAETTNRECLDILIDEDSAYLNAKDEEGYTPLHLAVINGNRDIVKTLVGRKADVNCLDNEKHSPVHWATVCGEVEILDILLSNGASPTNADIHSAHPIHYAAQMCGKVNSDSPARVQSTVYGISPKKGLAILRRLIEEGAPVSVRDKDGRQPLLWASSAGSSDAILSLVNAGASVIAEDKDGLTALHCAASRGHTDCLETLIGLCGSEVDVIDNNGCTALFYAVTLGHADATELLLNYGSEPNRQDRKGRTPAHCGAAKGQLETIRLLSRHGSNLWMRNVRGDLPLHEAVISRRRDLVMWLLSLSPESVNAPNNDGRSPIHMAALNNNVEMVKILIDHHSDINPLMRSGKGIQMTPLDAAIHRGNSAVAKFLQLHGGIPANSLNDAAFQRRLNRTLESQPGSSMGITISRLGLNEPELRNLTSPDGFGDSFMATSTPIMPETEDIKGGQDDDSGPERSKRKSDKRRKKRSSLGKGQEDGGSTDSGAEQEARGSRKNSRKSSRKNSREGKSSEDKSRPQSSEKPIKEETEKKPTGKERLTNPQSDDKFSELENSAQTSQAELKREGTLEGTEIRQARSVSKEDSQEDAKKKAEFKSRASSRDKVDEEGKEDVVTERKLLRQESQAESIMPRQESLKDIKAGKEFKGRSRGDSQEKITKVDSQEKNEVIRGGSEDKVIRDESPNKMDRGKSQEKLVKGESKEKVIRCESKERAMRGESEEKLIKGVEEEKLIKRQSQEKVGKGQSEDRQMSKSESEEKMKREKSQERTRQESVEKKLRSESVEKHQVKEVNKDVKRSESKEEKGSKEIEESKELKSQESLEKERRKSIMEKKRESLEERSEVRKKSISEAKEKRESLEKETKGSFDEPSKTPKEKRKSIAETKGKSISDSKGKSIEEDHASENRRDEGKTPTNKPLAKIMIDEEMIPIPSHPTKEIPRTPIKIIPQVEEPPDFEELELERRSFRSPIEREIEQLEKFVTYKKAEPKSESKPNSKTKANKKPPPQEFIPHTEHISRRDSIEDLMDDLKMPILPSMNVAEGLSDLRSEMFSPPKPIVSQKKKSVTSASPQRPVKAIIPIGSDTSREGSPEKTRKESIIKPVKKVSEQVRPLDQDVDLSDNSTTLSESFMSASEFIEKRQERKQRVYAPKPRSRLSFGDDTRIGESRIPPKFRKGVDVDTPISVTQAMQASMRKYHLERKIFQELLELKRLQIRAGKSNEQVLVKRLSDSYKKAGLSINFREYDGPFTFRSFEKYLYDQLRLLQANRRLLPRFAPSDDLEKLSVALKKMNSTKLPFLDDVERGDEGCGDHNQCTHMTHRCHHAAHAYTGVPCAAYIGNGRKTGFLPRVDPLKAPGPTQRDVGRASNLKLSTSRDDTQSPITLEVQQGSKSQVFALPSQTLDPTKNYYVSLSIKPTTAGSSLNPSPIPITINASGFKSQKQTVSDDGSISAPPPNDNAYISVDEINRDKHNVSL